VRCFWLLGAQEFHCPFPVIVGEVLCEYGLHVVHQVNNLFKPNIIIRIIPIRKQHHPFDLQIHLELASIKEKEKEQKIIIIIKKNSGINFQCKLLI
jgi:hypothetical protein